MARKPFLIDVSKVPKSWLPQNGPTPEFELLPHKHQGGRGFVIQRVSDGQRLSWRTLPRTAGLRSVNVVGESHHPEELQDDAFAVGSEISLVPEPDNPYDPNAVGVWDKERTLQIGHIPRDEAPDILRKIKKGDRFVCISMWEIFKKGKRVSLRLLLVDEGCSIRVLEERPEAGVTQKKEEDQLAQGIVGCIVGGLGLLILGMLLYVAC